MTGRIMLFNSDTVFKKKLLGRLVCIMLFSSNYSINNHKSTIIDLISYPILADNASEKRLDRQFPL